jgi:3-hydroxyisobutyrate dehydrogenase-like beta-hydroxyacid dehydrogenase
MANETTIAVVGLGRMGRQMATRLAGSGFALRAWNRTRARAEELGAAQVCASPREAAAGADIVITSLADDAAAHAVVLGDEGVLAGQGARAVHVSTSTISPGLGRALAEAHRGRGRAFLASPVLGRPDAAGSGQLTLLLGGDDDAIARAQPALAVLGRAQLRVGDAYQAQLTKVIANFMIAGTIELLAEATTLGEKGGIAPADLVRTLSSTVLASPIVDGYGKRMAAREYQPAGFAVPLGLKDVELALASGRELRAPLPVAAVVRDHLVTALARGRDDWDWTALASAVREASGLDSDR